MQFDIDNTLTINEDNELAVNSDGETLLRDPKLLVPASFAKRGNWIDWVPDMYIGSGWGTKTTIGNGQFIGKYYKMHRWVYFESYYLFGSTTSFNAATGLMHFSLPVAPETAYLNHNGMNHAIVHGYGITNVGGNQTGFIRSMDFTLPFGMGYSLLTEAGTLFTSAVPGAWVNGSYISVSGRYTTWH